MKKRDSSSHCTAFDWAGSVGQNYVVQQIPLGEVRSWIPNFVSLTYRKTEEQPSPCYKTSSGYLLSLHWSLW